MLCSYFSLSASKKFSYGAELESCAFNNDFEVLRLFSLDSSNALKERLNIPSCHIYSDSWMLFESGETSNLLACDKKARDCKQIIQLRNHLADCLHFIMEKEKDSFVQSLERCILSRKSLETSDSKY